jgi:hypothetical protein
VAESSKEKTQHDTLQVLTEAGKETEQWPKWMRVATGLSFETARSARGLRGKIKSGKAAAPAVKQRRGR